MPRVRIRFAPALALALLAVAAPALAQQRGPQPLGVPARPAVDSAVADSAARVAPAPPAPRDDSGLLGVPAHPEPEPTLTATARPDEVPAAGVPTAATRRRGAVSAAGGWRGRSGALRAVVARAGPSPALGVAAGAAPGAVPAEATVLRLVPFAAKRGGVLNGYRIGRYPLEGAGRTDAYAPPEGFLEVTPQTSGLPLSEHFQLGQFVTKNQHSVWPKYVALDLRLIDKLELVLQELNAMGVRADRMHVMSGYRTPEYNGPGGNGRARLSRHTYGDAADVWVDSDANGYMDDLNGDGRADMHDAAVILRAVDRVEQRHPDLVGGAGIYVATAARGPFIHVDVRGQRARW